MKTLIAISSALIILLVPIQAKKQWRSPVSPYIITINENGFDTVSLGATVLGANGLQLINGAWYYDPTETLNLPTASNKTATYQGTRTLVDHTYTGGGMPNASVHYIYDLLGGDIQVEAQVTNTGAEPIAIPAFRTPYFLWDSWPAVQASGHSVSLGWDQSHTRNNPTVRYPSSYQPLAGAFATSLAGGGLPLNLAIWPRNNPRTESMTLGFGTFQITGVSLGIFFHDPIPIGVTKSFKFSIRFSDSTDWKVLLQGYKDTLRSWFQTLPYSLDARPIATFSAFHTSSIRADNPYGYNDGGSAANCVPTKLCRRFDLLVGCQNYVSELVGPMVNTNYSGIIFWQPRGEHPRGIKYRPDFDQFPAETIPNLPTLFNGFINAGLSVGLLARPPIVVFAETPELDGYITPPTAADAMADLQPRFTWAAGMGISRFYLDSFLNVGYDHELMEMIRQATGNWAMYAEHSTALSIGFSGAYAELRWTSNGDVFFTNVELKYLRFLYPEAIIAVKFVDPAPPEGYARVYQYMFENRLTPLVEDFRVQATGPTSHNAILKPLIEQFINSENQWIIAPARQPATARGIAARQLDIAPRGIASNRL